MKDRTAPKPGTRNQQSLARAWLAVLTNLKIEHVDPKRDVCVEQGKWGSERKG